jgi:hypothetical protein
MNKLTKRLVIGLFVLLLVARAQPNPDKILESYKPVVELSMQVMAMLELDTTTELTLSAEQATTLLPILTLLQESDTLTNDEAAAFTTQINEEILTPEQVEWVAQRSVAIMEETKGNPPPGGFGLARRLMNNEPVNLVRDGFSKDALPQLVEAVSAKAA